MDGKLGRKLKMLRRCAADYQKVSLYHKQKTELGTRALMYYDGVVQDPDLASLLGLLYISQDTTLLKDSPVSQELLAFAARILEGGEDGKNVARLFLQTSSYRAAVQQVLSSSSWQRKLIDVSEKRLKRMTKPARKVYTKLSSIPNYVHPYPPPSRFFGKLSDDDLELVLGAITSEALIKEMLVPRLLPDHLTLPEKVQDAVEVARLMLLAVDSNIFYGCTFTYADLKAAAAALDPSTPAKQKLKDSSSLLWYMLLHPSSLDKRFRCSYLNMHLSIPISSWDKINVLNPKDFPEHVPEELQGDLSELELRIARILPCASWLSKVDMVHSWLSDDISSLVELEPLGRQRVCLVHRLIPEVSPSPSEVFEAMVLEFVVGAETTEELSKKKQLLQLSVKVAGPTSSAVNSHVKRNLSSAVDVKCTLPDRLFMKDAAEEDAATPAPLQGKWKSTPAPAPAPMNKRKRARGQLLAVC